MSVLEFDSANSIFYTFHAPTSDAGVTFVFYNALTGDYGMWEGAIGEALRAAGHGTLSFNFRGQAQSPIGSDVKIDAAQMTADAARLLEHVKPPRAVLVGLSIGGLFAIQGWLDGFDGVDVVGNIFINTLRRDGPRLQWINDGMMRCVSVGGLDLMRDLYMPLITNEDFQATVRENFLTDNPYTALTPADNDYNLLAAGGTANWDLPYEKIDLPTLVLTGQQDRLFYVEEDVADRTNRMPGAKRVNMANAAHMLPVERPDEFSQILNDFAADL